MVITEPMQWQYPWRSWSPLANAVPMATVGSQGKGSPHGDRGVPVQGSSHGDRGVPIQVQYPRRAWGPGKKAVPMAIVGSRCKRSTRGDRGVPRRVQYPWRTWGPGGNAVPTAIGGSNVVPGAIVGSRRERSIYPWRSWGPRVWATPMAMIGLCANHGNHGSILWRIFPPHRSNGPILHATTNPGGTGVMLPASLVQQSSEGTGGELQPVSNSTVPGLALIPPKLVQKILKGEFVDMYELLPETWRAEEPRDSCCRSSRPKRGLVTDISLWTECYASLVAVLTTMHPDKAPHFMGYLRTIVRASRNFEGTAWASYDAAYHRQAANRHSLDWATIDPTIYNEAFTGRARPLPRCRYCLAETHEARDCQYAPREDPPRVKYPRSAAWGTAPSQCQDRSSQRSIKLCELYNSAEGNRCTFKWCRFAHVCAKCRRGPHPASECNRGSGQRGGPSGPHRQQKEGDPPRRHS